jgi:WD40 repeat protein
VAHIGGSSLQRLYDGTLPGKRRPDACSWSQWIKLRLSGLGFKKVRSFWMQRRHLEPAKKTGSPRRHSGLTSAHSCRLAAATPDNIIHLFDEAGDRKDKFRTKAGDATTQEFSVLAIAFSPDGSKLAVAQSNHMVLVYRLGVDWGEKKGICNKFQQVRHNPAAPFSTLRLGRPSTTVFKAQMHIYFLGFPQRWGTHAVSDHPLVCSSRTAMLPALCGLPAATAKWCLAGLTAK